jgi:hypothetical protein
LERKKEQEEGDSVLQVVGLSLLQGVAAGLTGTLTRGAAGAIPPSGPPPAPAAPSTAPPKVPAPEGVQAEAQPKPKPGPEPLPRDPDVLRQLLASHLRDLDLLILDDQDMASLLQHPETAAVVQSYVATGGSLFAFVAESGSYERIVGAPFTIESKGRDSNRFEIAPGEVSGLTLALDKKKVKVKSDRILPQVKEAGKPGTWRVLAFTNGRKDPRILERGGRDREGFVALWCDRPEVFRGRRGGTVPEVEGVRAKTERYVFESAKAMMIHRYGNEQIQAATSAQ